MYLKKQTKKNQNSVYMILDLAVIEHSAGWEATVYMQDKNMA